MKSRPIAIAALSSGLSAAAASAGGEILLANFNYTGVGQTSGTPEWRPFLSYGDPDDAGAIVMNNVTLDFADVAQGNRYDLTGDLAGFNGYAGNGFNELNFIGFYVPGGTGPQFPTGEVDILFGAFFRAPGVGIPDYQGYTITRIEVLGTAFQSGGSTGEFEVTTEFYVYGVPSPGAGVVLGMAGIFGAARRRR